MRKLILDVQDLDFSPVFLAASPVAFGAWVRLSMYCVRHMTGGTIEGCRTWDTHLWARACSLDCAAVSACVAGHLAEWSDTDLQVVGYSVANEKAYIAKSKGASKARSIRLHKSSSDKRPLDINSDIRTDISSLLFSSDSKREIQEGEDLFDPPASPSKTPPVAAQAPSGLPPVRCFSDWLTFHPNVFIGKDREDWNSLFGTYGYDPMSDAYKSLNGPSVERLYVSEARKWLSRNYKITP